MTDKQDEGRWSWGERPARETSQASSYPLATGAEQALRELALQYEAVENANLVNDWQLWENEIETWWDGGCKG